MAEVDPKLCIALDDINEAMDCENQDNMGGIIPSVIFGYHADVATWPDYPKRRMIRFHWRQPVHWSVILL